MKTVELYAKVRRSVLIDGMSQREAALYYGIHRLTVRKMLDYSLPPGYRRRAKAALSKLDGHKSWIDAVLEADKRAPKKQRHTIRRIHERLQVERDFTGGYAIVRDYVARQLLGGKEMFVPLRHAAGSAQADFGEADAYIGGVRKRVHYFCLSLPQSDACFVKVYEAETAEAFCDGHVSAFAFFGGVPLSILYDNTRLAVSKILGDGRRLRSHMFCELQSHYLFEDRFGRPGKGNDKGKVEGLVGFVRRNFMTPLPVVESLEVLNARLLDACRKRQRAILRGHSSSIGERLAADIAAFSPLPRFSYDACHKVATRVTSLSLVRYRANDYSVPTQYGHREVLVKGYVDRVEVVCAGEKIASHKRSYENEDCIFDPLHYLALLERKSRALDQAAPLKNWILGDIFTRLRRLMEARMGNRGRREFIQVLRLMETFSHNQVEQAASAAIELGAIGFDAVKMLLLARLEQRPARLDLTLYPYLPAPCVGKTDARAYLDLLGCAQPYAEGARL